jgi:hypothetical protein
MEIIELSRVFFFFFLNFVILWEKKGKLVKFTIEKQIF